MLNFVEDRSAAGASRCQEFFLGEIFNLVDNLYFALTRM